MAEPALSVIVPVRALGPAGADDRSGVRLDNCLGSLRWQDLPAGDCEIVISDFGSAPAHAEAITAVAGRWGARVVRTRTDEVWNRSRALNVGIRAARGVAVLCTDVDMVFAPNFLGEVTTALSGGPRFVVCRCRDLPPGVPDGTISRGDYPDLLARAPYRDKLGTGACQAASRSFFERVRGYDEGYVFWGMEDNDMRFRARRAGLEEVWIHERTAMLHQWHPSQRGRRPWRKFLNDVRFHLTKRRIAKNPRSWGLQP